jgi:tRNA-modifying protein YgfZ
VSAAIPAPVGDIDFGVPWHYGDPLREQRMLIEGNAAVDCSHLPIITVTGPDRRSWLHSLTTQHVDELSGSALALILSPHGHVEHELHIIDDGETTWIITQPGTAAELVEYLERMKFMLRVDVRDVSEAFSVVWEPIRDVDPEFPTWLVPAEFIGGSTAAGSDRGGDASRYQVPRLADFRGREVIVPRGAVSVRLGTWPQRAGTWAWNALRVAAAAPRLGWETDHRTLPHEVGWVGPGVHLSKGCYRGQEAVARVHNLGQPPRRMVILLIDGSDEIVPTHGDPVFWGDRQIGWVGSAVQHYEFGPIASAVIKRNVPVDAVLRIESGPGAVNAMQHAA